jgi:hypothetical protein
MRLPPVDNGQGNGRNEPPVGLARFLAKPKQASPGEKCEFCSVDLSEEHRHVANVEARTVMCACTPCYYVFAPEGASRGKYRAIPEDYVSVRDFELSQGQWDDLQIPVNMAFFFHNSTIDRTVAFYPSPAGATESLLPLETWARVVEANPFIQGLEPDVEALLLFRDREGATQCYLVPIDACYRLVGLIKIHWKGFDGGQEAWEHINRFFADVRGRAREIEARSPR